MARSTGRKRPIAFRVGPSTWEHLRRRAYEVGETQTSLAERYVEEGLRMDEHTIIYFREGAAGRRPTLMGTRLDVADVIRIFQHNENSAEQTAEYLEIPPEQVEACVRYYAQYKDEIDDWIARAGALAEREEALWRRQQEMLG